MNKMNYYKRNGDTPSPCTSSDDDDGPPDEKVTG